MEGIQPTETPKFKNPEEEIHFLRERLKEKERSLERVPDDPARERLARETIGEYGDKKPEQVLTEEYKALEKDLEKVVLDLMPEKHDSTMEELLGHLQEYGVKNTLAIVEKLNNPHITDDFHRFLIQYIQTTGFQEGLKPGTELFKSLHMKLFQISLPSGAREEEQQKTFKEMVSAMEQFYAGMLSIADGKAPIPGKNYFTLEMAISNFTNELILYTAVPAAKTDLFTKQIHAVFPNAKIEEDKDDYNIFNEEGASVGAYAASAHNPIFPLKTYDTFDHDPLNVVLNVFSRLKEVGEGAAVQVVISPAGNHFIGRYGYILDKIHQGVPVKKAVNLPETFIGELGKGMKDLFLGTEAPKKNEQGIVERDVDETAVEQITQKVGSTILNTNIRIIASAETQARAEEILSDLKSAFHQFTNTQGNAVSFEDRKKRKLLSFFKEFSYRTFNPEASFPLNLRELTTMIHFPVRGTGSPHLKEAKEGSAPAPMDLPKEGTYLGVNRYRGAETKVYMAPEDRMRHFYTIGQTGTGKTNLLKNMIIQDIAAGEGVCMIDPHGSDIQDVLANIPQERVDDVIYFDPAYTARPMGLNMLEYDPRFPEQKTFVVDELLSIFNKLFDMKVAGGPMFEQYFRNAALLVIEDPETGSTLLDISRVLADEKYREMKLSRSRNPIVNQFWRDIAVKAGGEASLANMVPYITSKFDVFTANEIMRPIIAQQRSAFNFRQIMDERKILLVNLSKGRLGDINANLIGLVLVGKILMAALSRVDMVGKERPADFYLYIDEFQNITTDSIAKILSEARKYRLSLNIAHQFIAQLEDGIRDAVFGNVGSMAVHRVGSEDAEFLEKQFEPVFDANDIVNIDNFNAYLRLLVNGIPVKPFNITVLKAPDGNPEIVEKLKELSYLIYGRDRSEVEANIMKKYQT